MGAENDGIPIRYLVELIHENGTALTQALHHKTVVHHFVANVDRCAKYLQCALDDFDGAVDAGTKSTGVGKLNIHDVMMPAQDAGSSTSIISTEKTISTPARG